MSEMYQRLTRWSWNCKYHVVCDIGREQLGFIWAIGIKVEAAQKVTERRVA